MPLSNPEDAILAALSGLSSPSGSSKPLTIDGQPNRYKGGYGHTTDHTYDPGVLVLPVASSDSRTVKVRVHGGYSVRTVRFDVAREDNPPILPLPADVENEARTDVLVSCDLHLPLPMPSQTQGHLTWRAKGEYVFVSTGKETTLLDVTTRTPAARVPGTDLLPLGGYPYSLGVVDQIASDIATGISDLKAYSISQIPLAATDRHVWPFPIFPTFAFNANLLKD